MISGSPAGAPAEPRVVPSSDRHSGASECSKCPLWRGGAFGFGVHTHALPLQRCGSVRFRRDRGARTAPAGREITLHNAVGELATSAGPPAGYAEDAAVQVRGR